MLSTEATRILAVVVLAVLAAAAVGWWIGLVRRLPYTTAQSLFWMLNYVLARVLWRAEAEGRFPLPGAGGAVIVSNHRSPADPCFIQLTLDRVVHWMVAKEYCQMAVFRWFFRITEMLPVSRGGVDTAATRQAIRCCRAGGLVGMFPEGRINATGEVLLPGRPGAALVALKARVPVVPYFVSGTPRTEPFWWFLVTPAKATVRVGRPIDISEYYGRENDRAVLELLTRRFLGEIARLAGAHGFEPRVAGRVFRPASDEP